MYQEDRARTSTMKGMATTRRGNTTDGHHPQPNKRRGRPRRATARRKKKPKEHHLIETLVRVRVGSERLRSRGTDRSRLEDTAEHEALVETKTTTRTTWTRQNRALTAQLTRGQHESQERVDERVRKRE
jgi:hypothetical protein